jgi:hypothetical protein
MKRTRTIRSFCFVLFLIWFTVNKLQLQNPFVEKGNNNLLNIVLVSRSNYTSDINYNKH